MAPRTRADLDRIFSHHPPPNDEVASRHGRIRDECKALAGLVLDLVPEGKEQDDAIDALERVMMHSNAGIARAGSQGRIPEGGGS